MVYVHHAMDYPAQFNGLFFFRNNIEDMIALHSHDPILRLQYESAVWDMFSVSAGEFL